MLVVNVSWTAHGISIGQVPQIVTSALSLCSTVPILYLMARELQRHLLPVLRPGLLAAGALIAVDQTFRSCGREALYGRGRWQLHRPCNAGARVRQALMGRAFGSASRAWRQT